MTEHQDVPGEDELAAHAARAADVITDLRSQYFQGQALIREHREREPGNEQSRAAAEEDLDSLVPMIRRSCAILAAYCEQAARRGRPGNTGSSSRGPRSGSC